MNITYKQLLLRMMPIIFYTTCSATNLEDSLKQCIAEQTTDTGKVFAYRAIANQLIYQDIETATRYADSAMLLAQKSNINKALWAAYSVKANLLSVKRDFNNAIQMHLKSISYLDSTKQPDLFAKTALNYANLISIIPGYTIEAVRFAEVANRIGKTLNDIEIICKSYVVLGTTYHTAGKYLLALKNYKKALPILNRQKIQTAVIFDKFTVLRNIATILEAQQDTIGSINFYRASREFILANSSLVSPFIVASAERDYITSLFNSGKQDEAERVLYALEKNTNFQTFYNYFPPSAFHALKANILYKNKKYDDAIKESEKAISIASDNDPVQASIAYLIKINLLYELNRYSDLQKLMSEKKPIIESGLVYSKDIIAFLKIEAELAASMHNFSKSTAIYKKLISYQDSVVSAEQKKAIAVLVESYEAEQKNNEILQLKSEKLSAEKNTAAAAKKYQFLFIITLAVFVILVLVFMFSQLIRKKNKELVRLNILKNELLGLAAHDLKTPLGNIKLYSDLCLQPHAKQSLIKENLKAISTSSNQMYQLVQHLLNAHKIESGGMQMNFEAIKLHDVVQQLINENHLAAYSKEIELVFNKDKAEIFSDHFSIRQIIENLLSNAIKYSSPGSKIWIETGTLSNKKYFKIEDEGGGFSEEDLTRLFTRNKVIAGNPTGDESKAGLGLYFTKQLADFIKAEIEVKNTTKGVVFTVWLS